jgi:hypothetical protein
MPRAELSGGRRRRAARASAAQAQGASSGSAGRPMVAPPGNGPIQTSAQGPDSSRRRQPSPQWSWTLASRRRFSPLDPETRRLRPGGGTPDEGDFAQSHRRGWAAIRFGTQNASDAP